MAGCDAPLEVAPYVDTTELAGQWYEIGHLPRPTQDGCSGTTATYIPTSEDGHFSVTHQCTLNDGTQLTSNATLYVLDTTTNAKLGIDLGGFIGDYWILAVPSDYHYLVVGHPSRQYLWILARDKQLVQSDLDTILTNAQAEGFDTSAMEYTNQSGGPASLTPSSPGCSVGRTHTRGLALGGAALALVALLRRRSRWGAPPPQTPRGFASNRCAPLRDSRSGKREDRS
jgi:apolipoprotein D and lipocalin family protein